MTETVVTAQNLCFELYMKIYQPLIQIATILQHLCLAVADLKQSSFGEQLRVMKGLCWGWLPRSKVQETIAIL